MKKIMMAMTLMFAFGCFAQTSAGGSSSSGSMGSGQSGSSSGSMSGQSGSMDNGSMNSSSNKGMKGEKSMKGCIESENGGYMLEEKGGKEVMVTGSDLSAHVGHMVKVHGMWQSGSMSSGSSMNSGSMNSGSSASNSSDSNMAGSSNSNSSMSESSDMDHHKMGKMDHNGQSFMVNKIDMISDQCKMDKGMSH